MCMTSFSTDKQRIGAAGKQTSLQNPNHSRDFFNHCGVIHSFLVLCISAALLHYNLLPSDVANHIAFPKIA